jgi:hypothetical protein
MCCFFSFHLPEFQPPVPLVHWPGSHALAVCAAGTPAHRDSNVQARQHASTP